MAGEVILRFEIFVDYVNGVKKDDDVPMKELILAKEELEGDIAALELKDVDGQNEELDLETYVLNSIMDLFYDDYDVSFAALFETSDLFFL